MKATADSVQFNLNDVGDDSAKFLPTAFKDDTKQLGFWPRACHNTIS